MARPRIRPAETGDVFKALADPNRRRALELLAGGESSVQDLARHFPMSVAAVSQHLRVLHGAGLVTRRNAGRRRLYSIDRKGLVPIRTWVEELAQFWEDALDRLESHLDDDAR